MAGISRAPSLSLCVIARDEAAALRRCLESAAHVCDEVVVVDTGSRDATVEVARAHGARVVPHVWGDDFAAARNAALAAARGTWVLSLDADEILPPPTAARLRECLAPSPAPALRVPIESVGPAGILESIHLQVRLFRRDRRHRWHGQVHEQLTARVTAHAALPIVHHGWANADARAAKLARNRNLLERAVALRPDDPWLLFHLAESHLTLGDAERAVAVAERALTLDTATGDLGLLLLDTLALARAAAGRLDAATDVCRIALALRPEWIDARLLLGQLCRRAGRAQEAELHFERWLADRERLSNEPAWPTRLPRLRTLGAEASVRAELAMVLAALGHLSRGRREASCAAALDPRAAGVPDALGAQRLEPAGHAGLP